MTQEEIEAIVKYFKDENSDCLIEAEVKESDVSKFKIKYKAATGTELDESEHFHKISDNDKWGGVELRVYYNADDNTPKSVLDLSTKMNRSGFEQYNKRLNNNQIIYKLFENGFKVGIN